MLAVHELAIAHPDQIWLEFSKMEQEQAWPQDGEYSNDAARWNAYINRLCLNILTNWLQEEAGIEEQALVWPSLTSLPSIWDVVNGTALTIGNTRIVLIPSDTIDIEEFCVPAEWVDIPSWAGDYYLAVQVNSAERWLRVWGYTTHSELKSSGSYDEVTCTYSLEREDLIEDLEVMWVAHSLCLNEKAALKPVPTLLPAEAETLLARFPQHSAYSPRLDVAFEQWAAILENPTWRQQLYSRRNLSLDATEKEASLPAEAKQIHPSLRATAPQQSQSPMTLVSLRQWLQRNFVEAGKAGWDAVENFLAPEEQHRLAWRRKEAVKQAKLIDLGVELGATSVVLLMAIAPEADEKVGILVQVHPSKGKKHLPPHLRLVLISKSGKILQEAQARFQDDFIQLRYFKVNPETCLSIQVALGDVSVTEAFQI